MFNFQDQLERSNCVFIGTVKEQDKNNLTFEIIKLYKGDSTSNGELRITQSNSSCYKLGEYTIGEQLLIYSEEQGIHNCSRTNILEFNSDLEAIEKLYPNTKIYNQEKYDEIERRNNNLQNLLINCGLNNLPTLNDSEIDFLIPYLKSDKSTEEFYNSNFLFVTGSSGSRITDKSSYFSSVKSYNSNGKSISNSIIWLDDEMRTKSGGYDAVIIYWVKRFSDKQLKKVIKKAKKQKSLPVINRTSCGRHDPA